MCQQRYRARLSLLKAGGGDDRNVVRHRVRSESTPSDRTRSISASIPSRSTEGRGMAVTRPCAPAGLCASAGYHSRRRGRRALRRSSRRQASGRAFCAPPLSKSRGPSGAASQLPPLWWQWSRPVCPRDVLGFGYRLQETSGLSRAAPILVGRVFFELQALELLAASIGPKFATANYST